MFLRCQVVDELVLACKTLSYDAAGTAMEVAKETGWTVVGGDDVAGQVTFAGVGISTVPVLTDMADKGRGRVQMGDIDGMVQVTIRQRGRLRNWVGRSWL